jgi:lysophospholipase L1-like esterase
MSEHPAPRPRPALLALTVVLAVVLAACASPASNSPEPPRASDAPSTAGQEPSSPPASVAPSEADGLVLVAIGDSIPYNAPEDCPGCTGFVDSFADALATELGQPVSAENWSRHDGARTIDILEQLESDDRLRDQLAEADAIVMSVGFSDQPPFGDAHEGCPSAVNDTMSLEQVVQAGADTSPGFIDTVVPVIREQMAVVFGHLRELAPDAAIATLTAYDSWRGWPELEDMDPATVEALYASVRYWFQQWTAALCEEAAAADAACIDLYAAFNGPDGTEPPGDLVAPDHTHPSQAGNDVIRDLLIDAGLSELIGN